MSDRVEFSWNNKLILICQKCQGSLSQTEILPSEAIKKGLKECYRENSLEGIRALTTSCLGVCPDNKIALAVINLHSGEVKGHVIDPTQTPQSIFEMIEKS